MNFYMIFKSQIEFTYQNCFPTYLNNIFWCTFFFPSCQYRIDFLSFCVLSAFFVSSCSVLFHFFILIDTISCFNSFSFNLLIKIINQLINYTYHNYHEVDPLKVANRTFESIFLRIAFNPKKLIEKAFKDQISLEGIFWNAV